MPLYEYKCKSCGAVFDVRQKFSDAPLTTHKGCGGEVERIICAPALQFKGTGWYCTDYAHKGCSPSNGTEHHSHSASTQAPVHASKKSEPAPASKS
jgi:putative FmdB family regulatory protein